MRKSRVFRYSIILILSVLLMLSPLHMLPFMTQQAQAGDEKSGNSNSPSAQTIDSQTMGEDMFPDTKPLSPQEMADQSDGYSKTYLNPDGTYTKDVYMAPIQWQDSYGNWQDIDSNIVKEEKDGYSFANASNAFKLRLSKKSGKGKTSSIEIGGKKFGLDLVEKGSKNYEGKGQDTQEVNGGKPSTDKEKTSLEGAGQLNCVADGNQSYYYDEGRGYSLEYAVGNSTIELLIKLISPDAPNSFNFRIDLKGMDASKDDQGRIHFYNQDDGSELFSITPPVMKDSNFDEKSGESASSTEVSMDITRDKKNKAFLNITADPSWLNDPARVYPVYIDPTLSDLFPIYSGQSQLLRGDSYVCSNYGDSNFDKSWDPNYGFYQLRCGCYDMSTGHNRDIIGFDVRSFFHNQPDDPDGSKYNRGAEILSSTFYAYCYYSNGTTPTWIHYAQTDWAENTVTWNNFPSTYLLGSNTVTQGNWFTYDVKDATQKWVQGEELGGWKNRGLVLDEIGNTYWKKFASWENGSNTAPRLRINYKWAGITANRDEIPVKQITGESRAANLYIQNNGEETWQCRGTNPTNPIQMEAYVTDLNGGNRQPSSFVDLPRDVKPGETISISIPITAPSAAGDWRVVFDLRKKDLYSFTSLGCTAAVVHFTAVSKPADAERDASAALGKNAYMPYSAFTMGQISGTMTVNLYTGNATCSYSDLSVSGRGIPFSVSRTYNSLAPNRPTLFGPGWFSNLDVKVKEYFDSSNKPTGLLTYYDEQGASYLLVQGKKDNTFVSPRGAYFKVEKNPKWTNWQDGDDSKNWKYKVTYTSGAMLHFDDKGILHYIIDTWTTGDGNYNNKTIINYSGNPLLPTGVTDASGRTFTISADSQSKHITSIAEDSSWATEGGHTPRTISYQYNSSGQLSQVTLDPNGHSIQYGYHPTLLKMTRVAENTNGNTAWNSCYIDYDANGKAVGFRDARSANFADQTYLNTITYSPAPWNCTDVISPSITSDVPGYQAHTLLTRWYWDSSGQVISIYKGGTLTDALQRTDYGWNTCLQNTQITNFGQDVYSVLGSTYFTYDGKGNVTRVEDELNSSEKAASTQDCTASQANSENPTMSVTPDGNSVSSEYDVGQNYFKTVDKAGAQSISLDDLQGNETSSYTLASNYANLYQNASFEVGTGSVADGWSSGAEVNGNSYSVQTVTDGSAPAGRRFQRLSVKGNSNTGTTYINQKVAMSGSTDYTLAYSFKNSQCYSLQNMIIVRQYDSNQNQVGSDKVFCPYRCYSWTRVAYPFKTEANAAYANVYLRYYISSTGQNAYTDFDAVNLYQGTRDSSFNYVENANMERQGATCPSFWIPNGSNVSSSTEQCVSQTRSLKIVNTGYATQIVNVKPNTRYLLSCYLDAKGAGGAEFYYQGDTFSGWLYSGSGCGFEGGMNIVDDTNQKWERLSRIFTTGKNTTTVTLRAGLGVDVPPDKQAAAYFDDVQLCEQPDDVGKSYDAGFNYPTQTTNPLQQTSYSTYDAVGNVIQTRDGRSSGLSDNSFLFQYTYNELNQIVSAITPAVHDVGGGSLGSYTSSFTYDNAARMTQFQDNMTDNTGLSNNPIDKVTDKTDPNNRTTTIIYNEGGGIKDIVYPNGWAAYFSYDKAGRLAQAAFKNPQGQVSAAYTFAHDYAGNLTSTTNGAGTTISLAYDKASRVTSRSDNYDAGFTGTFTYTKGGKPLSTTYSKSQWQAGAASVQYSYRDTGEPQTLTINNARSFSYVFDDRGRLSTLYIPDNWTPSNNSIMTMSYDAAGRPSVVSNSSPEMRSQTSYAYDAAGNITTMNQDGQNNSYTYDELSRLTSWTNSTTGKVTKYFYDANGNITQVTENGTVKESYGYDAANQITNSGFSYDANGNLTAANGWTYTYSRGSQLAEADNQSLNRKVIFEYDSQGKRTHMVVKDWNGNTLYQRYYHYDAGGNILCITDGNNGNIISSCAYDTSGHPVAFTQTLQGIPSPATRTYYLHYNAHGDVTYVTDDQGYWVKKYAYDPWGKITETSRNDSHGNFTALVCNFIYAGYFYDSETGLYNLGARYYSPTLRRFLTKDTDPGKKSDSQTLNPYQYCENNPVLKVDPSGQFGMSGWHFTQDFFKYVHLVILCNTYRYLHDHGFIGRGRPGQSTVPEVERLKAEYYRDCPSYKVFSLAPSFPKALLMKDNSSQNGTVDISNLDKHGEPGLTQEIVNQAFDDLKSWQLPALSPYEQEMWKACRAQEIWLNIFTTYWSSY